MTTRDVERDCTREMFVQTLRRLADSIEHEAADGEEELELQLRWKRS